MSIDAVVHIVVMLVVFGLIFGLLFFFVDYASRQFPSMAPWAGVAKVILMLCAILVLIGILLDMTGHGVVDMGVPRRTTTTNPQSPYGGVP